MLSTSYKLFLVMNQLRRRARISVPQLQTILDMSESSYSRIKKHVEEGGVGSLSGAVDLKVQRATVLLVYGFEIGLIKESTIRKPDAVVKKLFLDIRGLYFERSETKQPIDIDPPLVALLIIANKLL